MCHVNIKIIGVALVYYSVQYLVSSNSSLTHNWRRRVNNDPICIMYSCEPCTIHYCNSDEIESARDQGERFVCSPCCNGRIKVFMAATASAKTKTNL